MTSQTAFSYLTQGQGVPRNVIIYKEKAYIYPCTVAYMKQKKNNIRWAYTLVWGAKLQSDKQKTYRKY